MLKKLLKTTRVQDESLRRRALVLRILFATTFVILSLCVVALMVVYFTGLDRLVLNRLAAVLVLLAVVGALYISLKRRRYFVAASGLLAIYWVLATIMALAWGITLPIVLLLYAALIVLSGIVISAGYSMVTLFTSSAAIFIIQLATVRGAIHPDFYWQAQSPSLSDLLGYYFAFALVGVCSWLFNRQTDRSLHHALRAESALQREKELLEVKVEDRTRELQAAQLDKMQQMYRFAQLGQFSTSLLHDIGNHMSTLSVDVEGMSEQQPNSPLQRRLKQRITYIDKMVQQAYEHINGKERSEEFSVTREIREITKILQHNARGARVQLHEPAKSPTPLMLYGDPARFKQLIANLVMNAISAYHSSDSPNTHDRDVWVRAEANGKKSVIITVQDGGEGIPKDMQEKVFDPFYSTKHTGTGIGLYIVKQIVEEHFSGTVQLTSKPGETIFKVTLHAASPHTA